MGPTLRIVAGLLVLLASACNLGPGEPEQRGARADTLLAQDLDDHLIPILTLDGEAFAYPDDGGHPIIYPREGIRKFEVDEAGLYPATDFDGGTLPTTPPQI